MALAMEDNWKTFAENVAASVDASASIVDRELRAEVTIRTAGRPSSGRPAHTDPVLASFYTARCLLQREIDYFVKDNAVPIPALCQDGDGGGRALLAARVSFHKKDRFNFAASGDMAAINAVIVLLRDRDDFALDIAAWAPRGGMLGTCFGHAILIGEYELDKPRLASPLKIHQNFLLWLQSGRNGVVVLDTSRAWQLLHQEYLAAANVAHGLELRILLQPPQAVILVPETTRCAA